MLKYCNTCFSQRLYQHPVLLLLINFDDHCSDIYHCLYVGVQGSWIRNQSFWEIGCIEFWKTSAEHTISHEPMYQLISKCSILWEEDFRWTKCSFFFIQQGLHEPSFWYLYFHKHHWWEGRKGGCRKQLEKPGWSCCCFALDSNHL